MRVMIFGTFDRFHPGHAFVIDEAMKRGPVIVIVARDANVEKIKGKRPVDSEANRVQAIRKKFPTVDVRLGDPDNFLTPVQALKPELILLGYDQRLPPGVTEAMLGVPIERLPAHEPGKYKSSLMTKNQPGSQVEDLR